MADEGFKRKLTAILSADVIGYSRLMRDDEEATVRDIASHRVLISDIVQQHHGRVVDSPGDNIMAEFASVVDAVNGAIKIQNEIKRSNTDIPKDRRMEFRIGINLGDVIEEEELIYGDGVNIAARVEGLAATGGIAISGTVYEHIKEKLSLGYHYLGEQDVKNISEPVRVYRLLTETDDAGKMVGEEKPKSRTFRYAAFGAVVLTVLVVGALVIWNNYFRLQIEPASVEKMAFPLPEKPSIAVLQFNNLSNDPAQDYIAVGITENIISALSNISDMFVIASDSTLTYKGKPVKIKQVSEELGVRYVLEGSAQKSGNRVRVNAQLIDATTGHYLWSEKYDRELQDLFALQDEITHNIIVELQVKLTEGEQARVSQKSTTNLEAWSYANRGLAIWMRISKENNAKAMELFEKAVELDPNYVWAWVRLAWTHSMAAEPGWSQNPSEHLKILIEISEKVLVMDESNSDVHALLGLAYLLQREPEKAIAEGEKALVLGPTNAQAHVLLAVSMNDVGRFDDAIRLVQKAMRLHPYYPAYYLSWLGGGYRMTRRYEDALTVYNQLLGRSQKGEFPVVNAHLYLVDLYAEIGKEEEARAHAAEIFKIEPGFSLKRIRGINSYDYIDPALLERRLKALRKAGLPDEPPLPLPDKPSIAVLAFDNLSGDPEQEYFSDGISEEIISALSKTDQLFVIARNSSFVYKGKPVNVKQVARELGVRHVLEGSVRKSDDRVRVTAQLIDATTGHHLWSERYDRNLKDIFALQDEITMKIITALRIKLTEGEQARIWSKQYENIEILLKSMESLSLWRKGTKESHIRQGQVAQEIIEMAPKSPIGYRSLAWYYWYLYTVGESPRESVSKAFKLAQKAFTLDESDASTHALLGSIYLLMRKYEKAITAGERSIELAPNGAQYHGLLGLTLNFAGRQDEAIKHLKQGIRLNPFPPYWYFGHLSRCYLLKKQYEDALTAAKKALHRSPDAPSNHRRLAIIYALLNRQEEASAATKKTLEIDPNFSVERAKKIYPFKNQADLKLYIAALRKAGFPE